MALLFEKIKITPKLNICLKTNSRFGISNLAYVGIQNPYNNSLGNYFVSYFERVPMLEISQKKFYSTQV